MPLFPGIFASAISGHLTPADAGAYFPLGEFTLSATQTDVEFTNIPQTYKHLQIRFSGFSTGDTFMRFNGDTGNNYSRHSLYGNGSTAAAYGAANDGGIGFNYTSTNTQPGLAICDILDYQNTNKYKTARILNGNDANGSGFAMFASGNWRNDTDPITSIKIYSGGNFFANSSFALYGVNA
jgi:hypothetical protein